MCRSVATSTHEPLVYWANLSNEKSHDISNLDSCNKQLFGMFPLQRFLQLNADKHIVSVAKQPSSDQWSMAETPPRLG